MHPIVRLAKKTIEEFIRTRKKIAPDESELGELAGKKAGVFVCVKKHGELRGCIGTIMPTKDSVARETIDNAISAATCDTRFLPVTPDELPDITYSVDVLTTPEPVSDLSELDPKRYGVIVSAKGRRGLLLPDLEGVDTVERQIQISMMKAGISEGEPISVERFEVIRYK